MYDRISLVLTADNARLVLTGALVGAAVGWNWWAGEGHRLGAPAVLLAALAATLLAGRSDLPSDWNGVMAIAVAVTILAAVGAAATTRLGWRWVAAGTLIALGGVFVGVPETGPALLTAAGVAGLSMTAWATGSSFTPRAGAAMAVLTGWTATSGAVGRPWATVGGALCCGVAPWLGLRCLLPAARWGWRPGPWLLAVHGAMALGAARWVAVVPDAGWGRVATLAAVGLLSAAAVRPPA